MKKKLKIKFWKTEKALAMQILEQEGLPKNKEEGYVLIANGPAMYEDNISLRGNQHISDFSLDYYYYETNSERDKDLDKITQAITDELFTTGRGELKIGEMCEVSDDKETWLTRIYAGKSAKQLGLERRVIAIHGYKERMLTRWRYVRSIAKRTEPKVKTNGEIITYTWEEE